MARRSSRVGEKIPHTLLVYSDWDDRNRLINSFLAGIRVRWSSPTVLSAQPEIDARFFGRKTKTAATHRYQSPPTICDAREFSSGGRNPSDEVVALWKSAQKRAPSATPPIMVGDYAHLVYDRFEVILDIETKVDAESFSPICCYREEGFWSLDPKQIIGIFETHETFLRGSTTFEMAS